MAAQNQGLQSRYYRTKILQTQKGMASADYLNNRTRRETTLYKHGQYWQKNSTHSDMKKYVLNYTLTFARK